MDRIYDQAIIKARGIANHQHDRLIDRTGLRYLNTLMVCAHYYEVIAWCYRRKHAAKMATRRDG